MSDYIEREAALAVCQKEYEERLSMADWCGDTVAWNIGGAIKSIPAADVVEVRRGRWYLAEDAVFRCSECGRICYELNAPYCYCGALMREVGNGEK